MTRFNGGYAYLECWPGRRTPVFSVALVPNVADRFKRMFPGHDRNTDTGEMIISATTANALDLRYFADRWKLTPVNDESAMQLAERAAAHEADEEALDRVLDGELVELPAGGFVPTLTPRDYQVKVPAIVRARKFLLLGDDLGLGKTLESALIFTDPAALPAIIVCPGHLERHWAEKELPKYYPDMLVHRLRGSKPYAVEKHRSCKGKMPQVLVTTYGKLYGWADHLIGEYGVQTVIFDEGHELRTGEGTIKYTAALMVARAAKYKIMLTGTPVFNWADELWWLIDLLCEGALGTKSEFQLSCGGAKRPRDPRALGQRIRAEGMYLRRTKEEVGIELPKVSQMIYPVESDQKVLDGQMAGIIATAIKILDPATDRIERFNQTGEFERMLRRATGVAKAPSVAALVRLLMEGNDRRVILIGWHHDVYEIWKRELAAFDPVFYTGMQSPTQKEASQAKFMSGESRLLIGSLRSGAGIDGLQQVCATQVHGELDWAWGYHRQWIGRCDRPGQTTPVDIYFPITDEGSDPKISDLLELKRQVSEPITDPDAAITLPSSEEAMHRVQALARDFLRRHGVDVPKRLPDPDPAAGELFTRQIGSGDQEDLISPVERAHAARAARAAGVRVLEAAPTPADVERRSRESVRARLTSANR
jgi:hypothetical protein